MTAEQSSSITVDNPILYDHHGMQPQCTYIVHFHSCRLDAGHSGKHSPGKAIDVERLRAAMESIPNNDLDPIYRRPTLEEIAERYGR